MMVKRVLAWSLGIAVAASGQTVQVVSPNSRTAVEGNDANLYPFSQPEVTRYQQAYGPGSLAAIAGRQVTQIAFRLDSFHTAAYAGGFVYPAIVITMSTSPRTPDTLLTNMDSNVGPDVQTVHTSTYTLPALAAGAAPHPFDMVITLEQPFTYLGGTLLIDVQGGLGPTLSSGQSFFLDCEATAGDSVGRVYDFLGGNVFADSRGLVTRFTAVPVQCYPNCDGSTSVPILNISDFTCFLNRFTAGESYANCDGSTSVPVLNVSDFVCFLNRFTAGC